MTDPLLITVRSVSRSGARLYGNAKRLGNSANATESQGKNQILDGYILRAVRALESYNVYILDTPAMVLLSGVELGVRDRCMFIGTRDDFLKASAEAPPTNKFTLASQADKARFVIPAPIYPPAAADNAPAIFIGQMPPQIYNDGMRTIGYRRIPIRSAAALWRLDEFEVFTPSQDVGIGMSLTKMQNSVAPVPTVRDNYMSLNTFWVLESEVPGWEFMIRRLVSRNYYQTSDPYYASPLTRSLSIGGAVIPASTQDGTDVYCMAAEVVNQTAMWASEPPGINYYDRQGVHGLGIFRGHLDRRDYRAGENSPLRARLDSTSIVGSEDLPEAIQPYPATYQGFGSTAAPMLSAYCWFIGPQVARCTDGFVTFCTYRAPNYREMERFSDSQRIEYGNEHIAMSTALVVVTNDNRAHVLKADRNDILFTEPGWTPIDTADADKLVQPMIVGVDSVARFVDQVEQRTAYALVWEEWSYRGEGNPPGGKTLEGKFCPGSATLGGEWALYSVESGAPIRTPLTGDSCAAIFHPNMFYPWVFPAFTTYQPTQNSREFWYTPDPTFSAAYYMGADKLVTACVPNETIFIYQVIDEFARQFSGWALLDEHDVSCAVIDVVTNTIEVRGVIAKRTLADRFCVITVAQQMVAAAGDAAEKPAALLAAFRTTITNNYVPQQPDETYLSVDGGWTWRLYIEDAAGNNGSFLIGNQLWNNDPAVRFG